MAILTEERFTSIASSKTGGSGLKGVVNEIRNFSKSDSITGIFLSQSHLDKDIIEQAKIFSRIYKLRFMGIGLIGLCPKNPNVNSHYFLLIF